MIAFSEEKNMIEKGVEKISEKLFWVMVFLGVGGVLSILLISLPFWGLGVSFTCNCSDNNPMGVSHLRTKDTSVNSLTIAPPDPVTLSPYKYIVTPSPSALTFPNVRLSVASSLFIGIVVMSTLMLAGILWMFITQIRPIRKILREAKDHINTVAEADNSLQKAF